MQFLSEVFLTKGYLTNGDDMKPIYNQEFVDAQLEGAKICFIADNLRGKDFSEKETLDVNKHIISALYDYCTVKDYKYTEAPKKVKTPVQDSLAKEAMLFHNNFQKTTLQDKINKRMQSFNILKDFEENGLYFDEGIVKLEKLITTTDIVEALNFIYSHGNITVTV
jgi:hypothetical protein